MVASGAGQHMLIDDQEDKPVTLPEALGNKALRNAILENVQLAAALNPSTREKLGVHAIGMALSFCAGAANAIAFAKWKLYVSHVSGSSTAIGLRMEDEQPGDVPTPVELVVYFIVGAWVAGLIIPGNTMKMGQARYEVVLFLVAAMELLCWWHELRYPEMLAAAMGLQNAMITSWSGAVLRTTHMTGTATDLGSALGRMLSRFFRRGCSLGNFSDQDWDEHTVDRQKFVLMNCLLYSFIAGGVVGAGAYGCMELHSLLIPAGMTAIIGAAHLLYCIQHQEPLATEKKAEEVFARQLSGGGMEQGDTDFLRQISGASARAERTELFIRQIMGEGGNDSRMNLCKAVVNKGQKP
mmetsp:Transcript_21908/g.54789  ORF Transcript_21908/g.54789 Transcript_21908/m.54789 type:complete len:353 (+) Transcript_21908:90-1148(+)